MTIVSRDMQRRLDALRDAVVARIERDGAGARHITVYVPSLADPDVIANLGRIRRAREASR